MWRSSTRSAAALELMKDEGDGSPEKEHGASRHVRIVFETGGEGAPSVILVEKQRAGRVQNYDWTDAYVFFKHEDKGAAPKLAAQFITLLED